ncbi:hypothetical protein AMATHDRAFT_164245 [Amanita thiersii Skay4041]|uniref:Phospholipid/glycerol acyltransferase domain-containing protein n=1 Tax=Amanita thiersii Skay4041 TaxID=703135 RepID=A0A2A9N7V5_9AGAR|nr:hypothetical protein AMATHDRAFT_164245 [Amanita thiersii Skay4041]
MSVTVATQDRKVLHRLIRYVSGLAAASFFTEIRVIGGENVPQVGSILVAATHHNMIIDPIVLSVAFPHKRILNYWSKASLFINPVLRYILYSSGNIPVDRKSKDRQILFRGTFDALKKGQAVALFPEGTSYTEPKIMQVKDGAAWAALEYLAWLQCNPEKAPLGDVQVIPVSIVYTNKSKYRSAVVMEFGRPITMDAYKEEFFSEAEGSRRSAVKRLTYAIRSALVELSINAPDWDTLYVARMARDMLWEGEKSIDLDDFVVVSQTLVDLFSTPEATPNTKTVRRHLLEYYSLLESSHLTNSVLSSLSLSSSLDPHTPATLPSRLVTLFILIRDTVSAMSRLPFFLLPLLLHVPVYFMGRIGASLAEDEEETQAQNKVAFGLLSLLMIYPTIFLFLWALLYYTPLGALLAAFVVYLFATYHNKMIDGEYAKQCAAAWRVLVGVWVPKKWDLSLAALSPYMVPRTPPENPWIERSKPAADSKVAKDILGTTSLVLDKTSTASATQKPPSRRIIRHVLRARIKAKKELTSFFDHLQKTENGKRVGASEHLARLYGGVYDASGTESKVEGWRYADEVICFLKKKGAQIPSGQVIYNGWEVMSCSEGYATTDEQDVEDHQSR